MKFFIGVLIYLLAGSVCGIVFIALNKPATGFFVPLWLYFFSTIFIIFLLFNPRQPLLFKGTMCLLAIQLFSVKLKGFAYAYSIGACYFVNYRTDTFSLRQTVLSFSYADFFSAAASAPQTVGINLVAFILIIVVLIKRMK